ncbi:MAG: hypothetical protein ACYTF6_10010 [Planctomycetota bacterium]|jgi:hypothetical protein
MKSLGLKIAAIAVLVAATASGAAAERKTRDLRNPWSLSATKKPPKGVLREKKTPVMPAVYAAVGAAGICVVGYKKPKRTHLD